MAIRTRLTLWFTGMLFVSLLAMGVLSYYEFVVEPRSQAARELQVEKTFHLAAECLAIAIPPDFFHSRHVIGVEIFNSNHFLQTEASVRAAQAAGLYAAM